MTLATHDVFPGPADPRREWAREYAEANGRPLADGLAVYDNAKRHALRVGGIAAEAAEGSLLVPGVNPYLVRAETFRAAEAEALAAALADPSIMALPDVHVSPLVARPGRRAAHKPKEQLDYA